MKNKISYRDRVAGAIYGLLIADALAMPVHWYYDTDALRRDYGQIRNYLPPKNPHPDSILWRSSYVPTSTKGDILHDQAQYWGEKGIHYHQFLTAGENTLNGQLAAELLEFVCGRKNYDPGPWLDHFISFLTTPGNHRDTYVEEHLRHFFTNYGRGIDPERCGRKDEHHIGGLTLMLPLTIYFSDAPDYAKKISREHLALTHGGPLMSRGAALTTDLLIKLLHGAPMIEALEEVLQSSALKPAGRCFLDLLDYPDHIVVGRHYSSACYMDQALPATLFLAAKYHGQPEQGLIANTMCGGDNCGRGSLLGALLGAACGVEAWPLRWRNGLLRQPALPS
ncbi:MAG: ADP-ribosylglycohydrolase family protein [Desulfofustis sp.]|nr:ADP-ribosylglycohydrolase family protein [Desulfofustis sp.]